MNTPFQTLERHPHGFVETTYIPFPDYVLQHPAYFGTVLRELRGIFIVNQLVLVG